MTGKVRVGTALGSETEKGAEKAAMAGKAGMGEKTAMAGMAGKTASTEKRKSLDKRAGVTDRTPGTMAAREKALGVLENLFIVILAFYPLRHIGWGLDLWDTGYSYANFQYMGTDHMDPMWLFSTYLANAAGHGISMLPGAGTLIGMNLYTGLLVSLLALSGFFFCRKALKMPAWTAFLGEFAALGLCWCPTAKLYDYLTYLFLFFCAVLLYFGLVKDKKWCLFGAGVCLGANVLVRFSNLPEAALILAVWAWDVVLWAEGKRDVEGRDEKRRQGSKEQGGRTGEIRGQEERGQERGQQESKEQEERQRNTRKRGIREQDGNEPGKFWRRLVRHTLWCVMGYLAALAVLLGWMHLRYGLGAYVEGIRQLFAMTDNAPAYQPQAMLAGLAMVYVSHFRYWMVRFGVIIAGGMVLFALSGIAEERLAAGKRKRAPEAGRVLTALQIGVRVVWGLVCLAMLFWLYRRGFFSFFFYSYDSIWHLGVLFLMLTMLIALWKIFCPGTAREERLVSGIVLLLVLVTSVGSNNGIYPSLNNLFLAGPYTVWESVRFIRGTAEKRVGKLRLSAFPAKGVLAAFLILCCFQFGMFGAVFVFAEGTGVQNADSHVENNEILKGVRMSAEKALWMTRISGYVEENGLRGSDVILYGDIPALSYYLQMPAAFNPWCSLPSYKPEQMERAMAEVEQEMGNAGYRPVVIVEKNYMAYWAGGEKALEEMGLSRAKVLEISQDEKWEMLVAFLERNSYQKDFDNGKFTVYR